KAEYSGRRGTETGTFACIGKQEKSRENASKENDTRAVRESIVWNTVLEGSLTVKRWVFCRKSLRLNQDENVEGMIDKKEKVVVAMSGGVDSAVSALLLMEQQVDVVGVTLRVWEYEASCDPKKKSCCSPEDIQDARQVGLKLDIPFY